MRHSHDVGQEMSCRIPICDPSALEGMHTGSLLSRLQLLQMCVESFNQSDRVDMAEAPDPSQAGFIEFKNSPEWLTAYRDLKKILDTRRTFADSS